MFVVPLRYDPNDAIEVTLVVSICLFFLWYNRKFYSHHFTAVKRTILNAFPKKWLRKCKWKRQNRSSQTLNEWKCLRCGQEGYSNNSSPPVQCQKFQSHIN
jgi:hypothetical protein